MENSASVKVRKYLIAVLAGLLLLLLTPRAEAQSNIGSVLGRLFSGGQQQNYNSPAVREKAANDRLNQGLKYFNKGDYTDALTQFQQALSLDPTSSYAYNDIGACYINLGQSATSMPYLLRAKQLNPTDKLTNSNLNILSNQYLDQGNVLINQGQYYQAMSALRYSVMANASNSMAYNDLGCAYMDIKQWNAAIPYLRQAIHVGTSSDLPARNLGICFDQFDASQAIPYYTMVLQINPKDSVVWGYRGYDHAVSGYTAAALYDYKMSLAVKPSADVYHWRGNLELTMGNDSAGYADLRKARAMNPNLGPIIAADIKSIIAQRTERIRLASGRQRFIAEERKIEAVVAQGPRYYQSVYYEAKQEGESNQEAEQKAAEARDNYNRDVALQNAWENGDYDTLNKIEAGEMSREDIEAYNPSDQSPSDSGSYSNSSGEEPSDNGGSMSSGDEEAPSEAPVESGGGDD